MRWLGPALVAAVTLAIYLFTHPSLGAVRRHHVARPHHAHLIKHARAVNATVFIPRSAFEKRKPRKRRHR